uniref:Non-homologous end-joining factor 1 n=1 Tax=Anopheles culicifacies TaxID=139723 RepID=A0A182LZ89_9DIPT
MTDFCELTLETKGYYGVHFSKQLDQITCLVFDMKSLWIEVVPLATLIKRQKEQNPTLDCTEALIDQTLLAGCSANYSADTVDSCVQFAAKYYLNNYPITFKFSLIRATTQEVSHRYIKPLWRTLLRQEAEIRALVEELKRKDIEIAQYQAEGARLNRTTVQTDTFDERKFRQEFPVRLPEESVYVRNLLDSDVHRSILMKILELEQSSGSSDRNNTKLPVSITQHMNSPSRRRKKRATGCRCYKDFDRVRT